MLAAFFLYGNASKILGEVFLLHPEINLLIPILTSDASEITLVITGVNITTREATVRYFYTGKAAYDFVHSNSLREFPEWHRVSCSYCKDGKHRVAGSTLSEAQPTSWDMGSGVWAA